MGEGKEEAMKKDLEANKDVAALSYIWILSIFLYFLKKDSPFVRFHARQGIVLFILSIIVWLIPFLGAFLELVVLGLAILGFLAAAQGQWKELPIISLLAKKQFDAAFHTLSSGFTSLVGVFKRKKPPPPVSPASNAVPRTPSGAVVVRGPPPPSNPLP